MKQLLRELGISMGMPGVRIMEEVMDHIKNPNQLTEQEVEQVLAAWETRHYVPFDKLKTVDRVQSNISEEDVLSGVHTQKEFDASYAQNICNYLLTLK